MSEALKLEQEKSFVDFCPITNDIEADKAVARVLEGQRQVKIMADWYKESLEKIKEQQKENEEFEMQLLRQYFDTVPHKKTATQESYSLPSGKLVLKDQSPEWERDEDELLTWAEKNGLDQFIKVKKSIDWDGLKKHLTVLDDMAVLEGTTKVVPTVKVVERGKKFSIGK